MLNGRRDRCENAVGSDSALNADASPRRARLVVLSLAAVVSAGLILATLGPLGWRPDPAGNADLDRLFGFQAAGLATGWAFPRHRLRAAVGLAICAALLEAAQALVPGRDPALADLLVKVGGGSIGVAAIAAIEWPRGEARYPGWRVAAVGSLLSLGAAGAVWWFDAPVAAARAVHTRLLADRDRAAVTIGSDPVIDVWGRDREHFRATVRRADCIGPVLIIGFQRRKWSWRATGVRVAASRPLENRGGCKPQSSHQ